MCADQRMLIHKSFIQIYFLSAKGDSSIKGDNQVINQSSQISPEPRLNLTPSRDGKSLGRIHVFRKRLTKSFGRKKIKPRINENKPIKSNILTALFLCHKVSME